MNYNGIALLSNVIASIYNDSGSDKMKPVGAVGRLHSYQSVYADQYIRLLARNMSGEKVYVAEIGVQRGCSIRAMRKVIPFAHVFGIDIDRCNEDLCGATFIHGDGYAADSWSGTPDFDLIIDDGSHAIHDIVRGIPVLISKLKHGGVLLIEDINSYKCAGIVMDTLLGTGIPCSISFSDTTSSGVEDDRIVLCTKL